MATGGGPDKLREIYSSNKARQKKAEAESHRRLITSLHERRYRNHVSASTRYQNVRKEIHRIAKQGHEDLCFIKKLPVELLDQIVKKLPFADKINARLTCKFLNDVVCCRVAFRPFLDKTTIWAFLSFLDNPVRKNCNEITVGDLSGSDYRWIKSSKLENIQIIHFDQQITSISLESILWLIRQSTNLRQLDFKHYNFVHFLLKQLNEDKGVDVICKRLTKLVIKGNMLPTGRDTLNFQLETFGAQLVTSDFDCTDLAAFTSLESLELVKMGGVRLLHLESLPVTLKELQLFTDTIQKRELSILANRLINLETLWIQSNLIYIAGPGVEHNDDSIDLDVPLTRDIFETLILGTNMKFFHYLPISRVTAKRYVATTSLQGSNIVNIKVFAQKQSFMVKIKRQVGYLRK